MSKIAELHGLIEYLRERLREHDCTANEAALPSCPQDKPCTACRLEAALGELDELKRPDTRVVMQYAYQQVVP